MNESLEPLKDKLEQALKLADDLELRVVGAWISMALTLYPLKARQLEPPGLGEDLYETTVWCQPDWRPLDFTLKKQMIKPPI